MGASITNQNEDSLGLSDYPQLANDPDYLAYLSAYRDFFLDDIALNAALYRPAVQSLIDAYPAYSRAWDELTGVSVRDASDVCPDDITHRAALLLNPIIEARLPQSVKALHKRWIDKYQAWQQRRLH